MQKSKLQTAAGIAAQLRAQRVAAKVRHSEIDLAASYYESASYLAKLTPREVAAAQREHAAAVQRVVELHLNPAAL
jgi:hypothetical protein